MRKYITIGRLEFGLIDGLEPGSWVKPYIEHPTCGCHICSFGWYFFVTWLGDECRNGRRETSTLTISPNNDLRVGDMLIMRTLDGRTINGEIKKIENKIVIIMNPTLWQRINLKISDVALEIKIKWWGRPKWLRF